MFIALVGIGLRKAPPKLACVVSRGSREIEQLQSHRLDMRYLHIKFMTIRII